jgi:hypothetical protein
MELSASRTVHSERKIQRVENDHFGGDASRHRHAEYRTLDHNVRHKQSLTQRYELEEILCGRRAVTGGDMREAVIIAIACFLILIMVAALIVHFVQ